MENIPSNGSPVGRPPGTSPNAVMREAIEPPPAIPRLNTISQPKYFAEFTDALADRRDLNAVLQSVVVRVAKAMSSSCAAWLRSNDATIWRLVILHHPDPMLVARLREIVPPVLTSGVEVPFDTVAALERGEPAMLPNAATFPEELMPPAVKPILQAARVRSSIAAPLRTRDGVIGFISVARHFPTAPLVDDDIAFVRAIAEVASLAIENAQLGAAAHLAQQRLSAIIEQMSDLAMFLDPDGTMLMVNRAFCEFFEVDLTEVVGVPAALVRDRLQLRRLDGSPKPIEESVPVMAMRAGHVERGPLLVKTPRGDRILEFVSTPITDDAGTIVGTMNVARDMTEQQQVQDLQREFLATAAHDLRNPLATILGHAQHRIGELTQGRVNTSGLHASFSSIVRQVDHLSRLVELYLESARIESGRLQVLKVPGDLTALVTAVVDRYRAMPSRPSILVDAPGPVLVLLETERIDQVLSNLIDNAIAHTPDGGQIRVTLRKVVAGQRREAELTVEDSGEGIAAKDLPRIFDRFFQAASPVRPRRRGSGLGLYICKGIVEAHGGRIWAESEPGRGSAFHVTLPQLDGTDPR